MKKIVFFLIIVSITSLLSAQLDTIGKYPYLYHYNWPETGVIQNASVYCTILTNSAKSPAYWGDSVDWWINYWGSPSVFACEYALYQHTDIPLNVIGLAIGYQSYGANLIKSVRLYDSTMTELALVSGTYSQNPPNITVYTDTNAHHFFFPGLDIQYDQSNLPNTYLYYEFFDKEIVVSGDYYIGYYPEFPSCSALLPAYIYETHGEPYHFTNQFRLRVDSVWSPIRTSPNVPVLFAILKLPCEPLDSVSLVAGADGCLHVDWEAPELQSSWTVSLTLPNGSEIMQPTDTNHWEYCGITPGAYYRVKVRSRCDDINGHSWSDWSREFSVGNPQAISETALPTLDVHPNPTDGTVLIPAEGIREVWCVAADGRRTQLVMKNGNVSLKDHTAGLYVLEIQTDEGLFSAKVIKK